MAARILSFAYSRGTVPEADLVRDMRFLRNPHWQEELRHLSGLDAKVGDYIAGDPAYADAMAAIESELLARLASGDLVVAFGCTGGRHRSVHVAEHVAGRLRAAGFSPTLVHCDLATPPRDETGRSPEAETTAFQGE